MQELMIDFMGQYGYLSVFLLITLENVFPPIPSEVILAFGGFMTTYTNMKIPYVIMASTMGSVAGAIILYFLGRLLDKERLEKIVRSRWGKLLRLSMRDIDKAERGFNRFGSFAVFICRMIPIIRSLISFPAGMAKMKFGWFLLLTTIGTTIWNTVLVYCGVILGTSWEKILMYIDSYSLFVCCMLGLLCITVVIKKLKQA